MAKKKAEVEMYSYGIYEGWNPKDETIPKIRKFTEVVPTRVGVEFGYVLHIRKARGKELTFCIDHPPFKDDDGKVIPPFRGTEFVRDNYFEFFIGDTIWEPVEDKAGPWRITCKLDDEVVADRTFTMVPESEYSEED